MHEYACNGEDDKAKRVDENGSTAGDLIVNLRRTKALEICLSYYSNICMYIKS